MEIQMLKGYVLDVDGTLYSQKKMRIKMGARLLSFYILRPHRIKELYALKIFRNLREKDEWKRASFEELYLEIKKKTSLSLIRIEKSIQYWMFQAPLDIIKSCSYQNVISYINEQHHNRKKVIVYSDYPATEKLKAIGMEYDLVFAFGADGIDEQKPSLQIMKAIVSKSGYTANQLLYVGDRDDRDKVSAELVNMPYCDIQQFRQQLTNRQKKVAPG